MADMRTILSLGAGVQSSTLALMCAHGEIAMPECAIFADTQWEPAAVYEWLDWLETRLPFPVHRVTQGHIRKQQVTARERGRKSEEGRFASLPFYTRQASGFWQGTVGKIRRQCTHEYKIMPIERFIRQELLGLKPRQRAPRTPVLIQYRGISLDEVYRAKPSTEPWMVVEYPLLDKRMTRHDCLRWMQRHGYPEPPRSACIGCPFHSNAEWRAMKNNRPDEWADAVDFDQRIRIAGGMRGETFLHRSCLPLSEVDLSTAEDHGQQSMFNNECEGMCGV